MPLGASRVPFNIHLQIQQNLEITITRTILNRWDFKMSRSFYNNSVANLKKSGHIQVEADLQITCGDQGFCLKLSRKSNTEKPHGKMLLPVKDLFYAKTF